MEKSDVEQQISAIVAILSERGLEPADMLGRLEPRQSRGRWWLAYTGVIAPRCLDLTDLDPRIAADEIERWNNPQYRDIFRTFEALHFVAVNISDAEWVEGRLHHFRAISGYSLDVFIESESDAAGTHQLLCQIVDPGPRIDLTAFDDRTAVKEIFGEAGLSIWDER